jgi:hypothetical protein
MNEAFVGKVAVVTGAARGIGPAISGPGLGQHLVEQSYLKSFLVQSRRQWASSAIFHLTAYGETPPKD